MLRSLLVNMRFGIILWFQTSIVTHKVVRGFRLKHMHDPGFTLYFLMFWWILYLRTFITIRNEVKAVAYNEIIKNTQRGKLK